MILRLIAILVVMLLGVLVLGNVLKHQDPEGGR